MAVGEDAISRARLKSGMGFWGDMIGLVAGEGVPRMAVTSRPESGVISWRVRLRDCVFGGTRRGVVEVSMTRL